MNPNKPFKVVVIERSLRCFWCGILGLLPLIGLPFAIRSLQQGWRVKRDSAGMWNPAQRYVYWGLVAVRISLAVSLIIVGSITLIVFYSSIFTSSQ